ncbi:N-acyl-D-amino-acid deacylase [Flexivirga endophytica]|uniref:N-acyl-D-amino-acid deacylase n=1 Tax=Flexivirga endophytica TaxID=1849103 RepID=A0A916WNH4_9MICO|nr:D-aminoacylase [Flexivirga endophytica]GGB19299.1 N-acyl-D-amino-acid deacylase [Flexivirga endophytica]GHB36387.1 N-acyl-D-amino-acid deacylase [Flexivirga endophytica]
MTADWLIRDASVIDGSGDAAYRADVTVGDGLITGIHRSLGAAGPARRVVDAGGQVLAPGFIDMHAHSDIQILAQADHTAKVSQGVTLEVLGQDGLSFAPIDAPSRAALRRQIAGWNGDPEGFAYDWDTVGEYLDRLDRGIACNAAYLVPQGTLRLMVVGSGDARATPEQMQQMQDLLAAGLDQGALGMSSGLTYPPGMFADDDELIALLRVVAAHGGYYSPHHRSYGAGAVAAYEEMIEVSRAAGCALHLTHATMNFEPNKGRAGELLQLIDDALASGVDITLDTYPYLPGATTLSAILPSWATTGGPSELLRLLADPAVRDRIGHEIEYVGTDGCHGCVTDWRTIQVSGVANPALADRVGRTVAELADASGRSATEEFFELLQLDELATTILQHVGHEENVQAIMRHRTHCGGSDAILVGDRPHPRAWGTFPRYLARYVRELGVLDLVDCVHHLTGRPAARLRLDRRGLVREGYAADLVLFDPDRVTDTATFEEPRQQADGIDWVFVNGRPVIEAGERTDALPGRALRHTDEGTKPL